MAIESSNFPLEIMPGALIIPIWSTDISVFGSGIQARNKNWAYPLHEVRFQRTENKEAISKVIHWYYNTAGAFKDFLFKVPFDFTSNSDGTTAETFADQSIGNGDGTTVDFQLIKNYTAGGDTFARPIQRPVSGTILIGIAGVQSVNEWSEGSDGEINFNADISGTIANISQATQAVIDFNSAHGLAVNDTFYISGVSGMTEINGSRAKVVSVNDIDTVTVDINTTTYTAFSASSPSGETHTLPQTGEAITAGYQFNMLVHFKDDHLPIKLIHSNAFSIDEIVFEETRI